MTLFRLIKLGLIITTVILSACSSTPKTPDSFDSFDWAKQQRLLQALNQWEANGKLGARSDDDAISANFRWHQIEDRFELYLSGAFGRSATIAGSPFLATLIQADQPPLHAPSPDELMERITGWPAPVSSLYYWGRGLPDPSLTQENLQFSKSGLLVSFNQAGWEITLKRHKAYLNSKGVSVYLPGKLMAKKDDKKITFLFRQWQLSSSAS
ncbi:MAG: lipoprotein insertase outer membrane protein LolB [Cellvibrionaceae bacterium]